MDIIVCVKQVPDDEIKIRLKDGRPEIDSVKKVVNVFDRYAVEMALRHCETYGGEVTVVSLGNEGEIRSGVVQMLAAGAKQAYIGNCICEDEAAVAEALYQVIRQIAAEGKEYDLILCGKESTDKISSQAGVMLAEKMKIPAVTGVVGFEAAEHGLQAQKETDGGYEFYQVSAPALFTVAKPEYDLRYPSIKGKMAARKMHIPVISGIAAERSLLSMGYEEPVRKTSGVIIREEEAETAAARFMELLEHRKTGHRLCSDDIPGNADILQEKARRKVLVYLETIHGKILKSSLEAITAGRVLGEVTAVTIGTDLDAVQAGEYGVSVVHINQCVNSQDEKTAVLEQVIFEGDYRAVLFSSTLEGKDLAPRLAVRFDSCSVTDVTAIRGQTLIRPVYGGAVFEKLRFVDGKKIFATIRKGSFEAAKKSDIGSELLNSKTGCIVKKQIPVDRNQIRTMLLEKTCDSDGGEELENADIVVAVGRGCIKEETFLLVKELAAVLGAQIGASRPVIESGWIARTHQIGQSGKMISPKLYIACGISGTMQHVSGITNADYIVAVNRDPDAPIFEYADIGLVGECEKLLPFIIAACKERKALWEYV